MFSIFLYLPRFSHCFVALLDIMAWAVGGCTGPGLLLDSNSRSAGGCTLSNTRAMRNIDGIPKTEASGGPGFSLFRVRNDNRRGVCGRGQPVK